MDRHIVGDVFGGIDPIGAGPRWWTIREGSRIGTKHDPDGRTCPGIEHLGITIPPDAHQAGSCSGLGVGIGMVGPLESEVDLCRLFWRAVELLLEHPRFFFNIQPGQVHTPFGAVAADAIDADFGGRWWWL